MNTTERPWSTGTTPRRSRLDRGLAMRLAATEYQRLLEQLRGLGAADWERPTECTGWDVRAMAGHCVGMATMATGLREILRQDRAAGRRGGDRLDALTGLQVEEHEHLTTDELLQRLAEVAPRAVRGRRRLPRPVRSMTLPQVQDVGAGPERWKVGYLIDTILTRDPWLHRMDVSRATGTEPHLTPDHDKVIVADVVAEWADRHGRPHRLVLEGPAGGSFAAGDDAPEIRLDAVDFCRVLSGRGPSRPLPDHPLLAVPVPF